MGKYDDLFGQPSDQGRAGMAYRFGIESNPNDVAQSETLAKRYGLPVGVVQTYKSDYENQAKVEDAMQVLDRSPKLRGWIAENVNRAAMAQNDIATLGNIERTFGGTLKDLGITTAKGVLGIPQFAVGLANIPTLGVAGKTLESVGIDINQWQKDLEGLYSPAQKAANLRVEDAQGFFPTTAAMLQNPSTIANMVVESLPSTVAGGFIARGFLNAGSKVLGPTLTGAAAVGPVAPGYLTRKFGEKAAPWVAAGLGEGAVAAGAASEQIRSQTDDGYLSPTQALAAVGTGIGTAGFGMLGGRVANRLGLADIDVMIAKGGSLREQAQALKGGFFRQIAGGGISEGLFEELPQSVQEQMWQNFALDRPLFDGVGSAAAMGLLAGGAMGGAGGGFSLLMARQEFNRVKTERQNQFITDLTENSATSELKKLNPAVYEQFIKVQAQGTDFENFYVDPAQMAEVLKQSSITVEQLAQVAPDIAKQVVENLPGTDIIIPTEQYAARLAGTDLGNALAPHMRIDPDVLSPIENAQAAEQRDQILAQATQVLDEKATADRAFRDSAKAVEKTMYDQLMATKKFPANVAKANAMLVREFVAKQARDLGMTPEAYYNERYKYQVEMAGQQAGQMFSQDGTLKTDTQETGDDGVIRVKAAAKAALQRLQKRNTNFDEFTGNEDVADNRTPTAFRAGAALQELRNLGWEVVQGDNAGFGDFDASHYIIARFPIAPEDGEYVTAKIRVANHGNVSRQFDRPDANIAPDADTVWDLQERLNAKIAEDGYDPPAISNIGTFDPNNPNILKQALNINTPAFRNWFKESKVVDAEGKPIVVYHGTQRAPKKGIDVFKGNINFFSEDTKYASNWANIGIIQPDGTTFPENAQVIPVYLSIQNPYNGDVGDIWLEEDLYKPEVVEQLKAQGYDGAYWTEKSYDGKIYRNWVVFEPNQIKSIYNEGTYSTADANILRQTEAEPRDLIIQHNLTAANLLHAVRMGGIPVPSLAITKKETPLTGFGEITLLGSVDMADPKGYAGTKVFGGDIYSPRYPDITFDLDKQALKKLNEALAPYREEGQREIYGSEISKIDHLTQRDEFKKYAAQLAGKDYSSSSVSDSYTDLKFYAEQLLRDVGAKEKIFQGFTYSGNRRYIAHTLDNVVKILKKELRGGENFNYGAGSIRAKYTPQFKSIAQIRKAKDRLMTEEGFESVRKEIDDELWGIINKLSEYSNRGKDFGFADTVTSVMYDSAKIGIPRALEEYNINDVPQETMAEMAEFLNKLRTLPTEYFEAKILRDVDLAEFSGAVVPEGTNPEVIKALESRGVKDIRYYKKDDDADRAAKIGQFENLFFQKKMSEEQSKAAAQTGDARGGFDPRRLTTILNEKADYSTFLHETGHFFLTVMADMAARPDATPQMKADMQTVLNWFGVADLAAWNAMSLEQQRKYHEQWAYNYEIYLFEGKAPSPELKSLFDRFSAWLKSVYKSIRDELNQIYRQEHGADLPILTGEVRQVMDRMLASQEQIEQAEAVRSMSGMFQSQAEAGMDDVTWAAYLDMLREAREAAVTDLTKASLRQMKWLSNARSRVLKELQKEADKQRKQVRKEVEEEILSDPVYRAMTFLKRGEQVNDDGTVTKADGVHKLSIEALESMYMGEGDKYALLDWSKLGHGQYGMLAKEGLHPDLVAEQFGFSSGDEMIRALLEAPSAKELIDQKTDERMLAEYGDMTDPKAVELAVEEALHNEARARFVAVELRFLAKSQKPVRVMLAAAKMAAQKALAGKVVRDIRPRDFSVAEGRAARQALDLMKQGKSAEAIQAKQNQVFQNQLATEAVAVRREIDKALDSFKKFFRPDEKIAKTRNMDLVDAARSILAYYGLGQKGKSPVEYIEKLRAYNPDFYAQIEPLVVQAAAGSKAWNQLTLDEFRMLRDGVEALWFNAKRDREVMIEGKVVALDAVEEDLIGRLDEIGIPAEVAGEREAPGKKDQMVRSFYNAKAITRRVEHWANATDGAKGVGPFTKYIWRPIRAALDAYRADRNKYVKEYVELIKKLDLPVAKIDAPELNYTFGNGNGGIGKAELLGALLHTGNDSNRKKLLVGRGWGTINEDGTLDDSRWRAFEARMIAEGRLTKADYDFAQAVWDLTEKLKPMAQEAHKQIEGYYFKEVEATPLVTPFGIYAGGYVPAKTDQFIVRDAQKNAKMEELEADFRYAMPSTGMGFTKSRVEYNKPLSMDIRMIAKHIDDVIRFAHVQPVVKDTLKILRRNDFSNALTRVDPTAIEGMLIPWLNRAARQITSEAGKHPGIDNFWRTVRSRTGISIMFANITNALQQVTGYFPAMLKVKGSYLRAALVTYIGNTQKVTEEVAGLSQFMADRLHNQVFDMQDTMNELLLNPTKFDKIQKWSAHHGYFLQQAFQNQVDVVTWTATFNQTLAELGANKTDQQAVREATQRADAAVRMTQSSLLPEDVAAFEIGTPFGKTLTQFSGYFNMMANLNADEYIKVFRDMGWRGNKGKLMMIYLLGFGLPMLLSDAIVRTLGGQWDDDDDDGYLDEVMEWFFGSQVRGAVAMVPAFGPGILAVGNAFNDKPYDDRMTTSPSVSALEGATIGVVKAGINIVSEDKEVTGKNIRDVLTLLSLVTGIPLTVLGRPIGYAVDVERNKVEPTSTADYARGLVTGKASEASKP